MSASNAGRPESAAPAQARSDAPSSDADVAAQLDELSRLYVVRFGDYARELVEVRAALVEGDEDACAASLEVARRIAHTLAGSAPTFGFHEVGEVAARAEQRLVAHEAGKGTCDGAEVARAIEELLGMLMAARNGV